MSTTTDAPDSAQKKRFTKGGKPGPGRPRGSKDSMPRLAKATLMTVLQNILGLDDEALERTGQIDQDGYRVRRRLREIAVGERTPDPAWTSFMRFMVSYAYGNPGKLQIEGKPRESLIFLTTNGLLPWDPRADTMKDKTDRMIAAKAADEQMLALEAKGEKARGVIEAKADKAGDETEVPETLELVDVPEQPEDFSRGGRGR